MQIQHNVYRGCFVKLVMFTWAREPDSSHCENVLNCILPDSYNYHIINFTLLEESVLPEETDFTAEIRVNVKTTEDPFKWISDFERSSRTNYNKETSDRQRSGVRTIIHGERVCHHKVNTSKRSNVSVDNSKATGSGKKLGEARQPGKDTKCDAKFSFSLAGSKYGKGNSSSKNKFAQIHEYPLYIKLSFRHNHSIISGEALKFSNVSDEAKEAFNKLFEEGLSASGAIAAYREKLRNKIGPEEFIRVSGDHSILPSYSWVFRAYT